MKCDLVTCVIFWHRLKIPELLFVFLSVLLLLLELKSSRVVTYQKTQNDQINYYVDQRTCDVCGTPLDASSARLIREVIFRGEFCAVVDFRLKWWWWVLYSLLFTRVKNKGETLSFRPVFLKVIPVLVRCRVHYVIGHVSRTGHIVSWRQSFV